MIHKSSENNEKRGNIIYMEIIGTPDVSNMPLGFPGMLPFQWGHARAKHKNCRIFTYTGQPFSLFFHANIKRSQHPSKPIKM